MKIRWEDCTPEIAAELDKWLSFDGETVENIKKYAMFDGNFSEELDYYTSGQISLKGESQII